MEDRLELSASAATARMWDCHAHLLAGELAQNWHTHLAEAAAAGVSNIVCVPETVEESIRLRDFDFSSSEYALQVHKCMGIHPVQAAIEQIAPLADLLRSCGKTAIGVGECGLDFSPHVLAPPGSDPARSEETKSVQRAVFDAQVTSHALRCAFFNVAFRLISLANLVFL